MSTTTEDETAKVAATASVVPKVEDPTASVVEASAAPVVATEALAAAAAAAVVEEGPVAMAGVVTALPIAQPPPTPTTTTQQQQQQPSSSRLSLLSDVDGQGKRRFFPRVKHLIGNKEWEDFLTQVLQCIEEAGAPETAAASHKANNAWYKAFDLIYGGVAREYSIPTGKNRYHKFKDKILEVWVALEAQAPGENHCRDLALEQYERYKRACSEASKNGSSGHNQALPGSKVGKTMAGQTAPAAYKLAGGKRSYNTAMGGGAFLPAASTTNGGGLWKNLDETAILEGLPETLRSLVHLKQLSKEMAAGMTNRAARRGIEEHAKKLDGAYLEALTEYLGDDACSGGDHKPSAGSKEGNTADGSGTTKAEESNTADVEMTDDNTAGAADGTKTETSSDKATTDDSTSASVAYDRCLAVAFLYRYASTLHEQKVLAEAYAKYTANCVTFAKETSSSVPPQQPQPSSQPKAVTTDATMAVESPEHPVPVNDEATAAAAAAAAMEEGFTVQI